MKAEEIKVKPEGSAWINSATLEETSFRWQEVIETETDWRLWAGDAPTSPNQTDLCCEPEELASEEVDPF